MKIVVLVLFYFGGSVMALADEPVAGTFIQASSIGAFALILGALIVVGRYYPNSVLGKMSRFMRTPRS